MKSPDDIAASLVRQWRNADTREALFLAADTWPVRKPIGKPAPSVFTRHTAMVREHKARWHAVTVGRVVQESTQFRSGADPVELPAHWEFASLQEWAEASGDAELQLEWQRLQTFLQHTDPRFHAVLIRRRNLWRDRRDDDVLLACRLALVLAPGIANGSPLRSVALAGIDTKFIERHPALVTALLDVRFEGLASEIGLAGFLNATDEGEHWLLVAPLSSGRLPFAQQRVRARELVDTPLPAGHILIIENERCLHLLPTLDDTVAVLGSGLDLTWLRAAWLGQRRLSYWGDMDTWGLTMLARARRMQPHLESRLMHRALFERHAPTLAVSEPVAAGQHPPEGLTPAERDFYSHLLQLQKGRIEQEFLPSDVVLRGIAEG